MIRLKDKVALIPRKEHPEDVTAAVAFLSSKDAADITAQTLCVNAAWTGVKPQGNSN